jgi:preprotein translocase subunit SecE
VARSSNHPWLRFLREVRDELAKVVWPSRREVVTYSIVVIVTVLVMGLFVFGLDVLFSRAVVDLFDE